MIKYSKNNELKPSERVDPCFNIIVGGVHINMLGLGAIAIDLIFTSTSPWWKRFCDVDMLKKLPTKVKRALPPKGLISKEIYLDKKVGTSFSISLFTPTLICTPDHGWPWPKLSIARSE